MSKKLAILGHETRSEEVIELLKMLGGSETFGLSCAKTDRFYHVSPNDGYVYWDYNEPSIVENKFEVFTLEKFLRKFPFKVGDFVRIPEYESEVRILKMKWCPASEHIEYLVCPNDEDEWFTADELLEYNDDPNKTRDCKKCGLHFGSVRCFSIDCPHNTPKSNAVGLKDGKVIDCKVNNEIYVNDEVKPIFKVGDEIARADGLTNSCIVIGISSEYYSLEAPNMSGVGVLPVNKQDEYILVNRSDDKEPEPKAPILSNRYDYAEGKCGYVIPDGYEFDCIKEGFQTEIILKPKKPTYPKTYKECCDILGFKNRNKTEQQFLNSCDLYDAELMIKFSMLKVCRDAYWKIAGEELEMGEPWEPKLGNYIHYSINFYLYNDSFILHKGEYSSSDNRILVFPTEEMRDAFYENFNNLIECCKELL